MSLVKVNDVSVEFYFDALDTDAMVLMRSLCEARQLQYVTTVHQGETVLIISAMNYPLLKTALSQTMAGGYRLLGIIEGGA